MDDHQHAAIEQARIAWHDHQFEHDCYGQDCAEDRRLYHASQHAIKGDLAEPGPAAGPSTQAGSRHQTSPEPSCQRWPARRMPPLGPWRAVSLCCKEGGGRWNQIGGPSAIR